MPGKDYIGSFTPSNQGTLGAYGQALSGGAAGLSPNTFNSTFGSGCPTSSGCIAIPGAWVPPWGVETGGVNWDMSFSEATANSNTTDFIAEVDDGDVYDADTGNSAGFTVGQYLADPNSYELPSNARVRGGNPLNGSSCKDINASYNTFSFRYPGVSISIVPPITFSFTPIGGSEVTMSGCPDSYYTLEGHLQNSPTSGIIYISGLAVQCTWETVT
jgi:hypothetical protein